jgi:purine-binding chemotaxis protein CheW
MDADAAMPPATLLDAVTAADEQAVRDAPAAPLVSAEAPRTTRFVLFSVASTCYAIAEPFVTELRRVPKITLVPRSPAWLRGVTNLRGDVLSVIDLRAFMGLEAVPTDTQRLVVVRLLDQEFSTGLLVDGLEQIATLEMDSVRPPASPLYGPLAPFLTGVCVADQRLIAVLDLAQLLRAPDIRQFDDRKEDASCETR